MSAQGVSGDEDDEEIDQVIDKVWSTSDWVNNIGIQNWWELLTQVFHEQV